MNRDNFQNNLAYLLTEEIDGHQHYKIVDGTARLKDAHVFLEASVPAEETIKETIKSMQVKYCDWLAINRNIIAKFYEDKFSK